jgi:ATP-dependent Lon protease
VTPRLPTGRELLAALREVPVFPLPQAVLFPGAHMPLHIFEPRYRRMTRDSLDTHRLMVVAHIADPVELDEHGHPSIAQVAGVGAVIDAQELPDGRFNLVLEGRARVRLAELPFVPPYRRAAAELFEDETVEVSQVEKASLLAVANAFVAFVQAKDPSFQLTLPPSLSAGRIADLCAHHLVLDARERQSLLETLDPAARARKVADLLAVQLAVFKREPQGSLN